MARSRKTTGTPDEKPRLIVRTALLKDVPGIRDHRHPDS